MRYYTPEEQEKAIDAAIRRYRTASELFRPFCEVIRSFDGKMINCRIEKALREATGRNINLDKRYSVYAFELYQDGCMMDLARIDIDKLTDKRVDAEWIIASAIEAREGFLKKAAELEKAKYNIKHIREQIEQLKKALDGVLDGLPYEAIDIYGLPRRLSY